MLFADEDSLSDTGLRSDPQFKPDWSPDALRSHNYIGQPVVFCRRLLERIGGFRKGFEASGTYDGVLRASEQAERYPHPVCSITVGEGLVARRGSCGATRPHARH